MIPPEKLKEWRALADAATPGPWQADIREIERERSSWGVPREQWEKYTDREVWGIDGPQGAIVETDSGVYPPGVGDARFIVAAREALPALLDEVERLRVECDEIRAERAEPDDGQALLAKVKGLINRKHELEAGLRERDQAIETLRAEISAMRSMGYGSRTELWREHVYEADIERLRADIANLRDENDGLREEIEKNKEDR